MDRGEPCLSMAGADTGEYGIFDGEQLSDVAFQPLVHVQAVASTLGNGGTSSSHSPASRDCLSTSTRSWSATRPTHAARPRPPPIWNTHSPRAFSPPNPLSPSTPPTP